jgi:hypothetical protein
MSADTFAVRRMLQEDIPSIRELIKVDPNHSLLFGEVNLSLILETSYLSVVMMDDSGSAIGFVALNDAPHEESGIPYDSWDKVVLYSGNYILSDKSNGLAISNSLWLRCSALSQSVRNVEPSAILHKLLTTCFATCQQIQHVLFAQIPTAKNVLVFEEACFAPLGKKASTPAAPALTILHAARNDVIPCLRLRAGIVEDYDDFIPLLIKGEGVVTPLPENLYLEELLENQDQFHTVIVAEDPLTRKVVGIMCAVAAYEDQQHAVKQYALDVFSKLKPQKPQSVKGQQSGHNVCRISFFYLNPQYDSRAVQFLDYLYGVFPFAEYAFVYLPHATPEHALLNQFQYIPIKKFQPTNVQGERLPLPEGMWLHCRYALEAFQVVKTAQEHEDTVIKLLRSQAEISQDGVEAMSTALSHSISLRGSDSKDKSQKLPFASYCLQWRDTIVGVAIVRHVNTKEIYALRENFDLDSFVNFVPAGNPNLQQTNHTLEPESARESFYTNDMPAIVVKHVYVKPIFRSKLRLLLREALRLSSAQVCVYMAGLQTETYTPIIHELFLVPPRRMVDHAAPAATNSEALAAPAEDVDGLTCLWHATRKSLSDEKTRIHARIVVIGSSTTGLACLHSLLSIPYLLFTNLLLVSGDGLPDHPNHRDLLWSIDTMDFLEREYISLKIGKRLRVMEGTMIDFDKFDKYICSDSSNCEPYDHLLITAGRQYTIPKELLSQHGAKNGVFPLSNTHHIAKVKQHIHESEIYEDDLSSAVIYGFNLDVFAVANSIVQLGLVPQRVVIVSPDPTNASPFHDPLIDLKVEKLLSSIGTKIIKAHVLERLEYDDDNNLCNVVVAPIDGSKGKSVELNATMFIYCHEKDIDGQVLSALNKRSIVFDGRVIIENNYRTTDKRIYAAGPVAMFSRRFGPSSDFDEFSARETGRHVAETLLGFLGVDEYYDPVLHKDDDAAAASTGQKDDPLAADLGAAKRGEEDLRKRPKPLPKFTANVTRRVLLPGDHMFFMAHSIGYQAMADQCKHLYSASQNGNNYVRLSIGPNSIIEAVSYFGNEPVELHNLKSLVGLPQSVLNLVYHYVETNNNAAIARGGVASADGDPAAAGTGAFDILAFLRSPWATCVFYDRFLSLYRSIQAKLVEHPDVVRVKADIMSIALKEETDQISVEDREKYHRRLLHDHSDTRHVIELELIKFLHANKAFLPQLYFLPDLTPYVPRNT